MQMQKDRKGLALGAIFALVASLFVGFAPAKASETSVVVFPNAGLASQTTMLGTEAFDLNFRYGTGVNSSLYGTDTNTPSAFGVKITKPAGVTLSAGVTYSAGANVAPVATASDLLETEIVFSMESSRSPKLQIALPDRTSISAAVAITVTPFLDLNRDEVHDAGEPVGTSITLNFVPWSAMGAAVTLESPYAGRVDLQGALTGTAGSLNTAMLDGSFTVTLQDTATAATASAGATAAQLFGTTNASSSNRAYGNSSMSFVVDTHPLTTSGTVQSASVVAKYAGVEIASLTQAVIALTLADVTISPVVGSNAKQTNTATGDARVNSAFQLSAYPLSTSTIAAAVDGTFSVSAVGSSMDFDADSGVIINGTTFTSSSVLLGTVFAQPAGTTLINVSTFGQNTPDNDSTLAFKFTSQVTQTKTMTITFKVPTYTVAYTPTNVAGPAGVAKSFTLSVKDNWNVLSARTDQRVAASAVISGSQSATVSAAVSAGSATVAVTPVPTTRTGSAVVTFTLQTYNQDTQGWDDGSSDTVAWNVYASAGSDGFVSRTASVSSSLSYGVVWSYSGTVAVVVSNSSSDVVVSAPGLVIQNVDDTSVTASDTLTVAATNKTANFAFASKKTGTYVVTFTNGSATTTSEIVFDAAPSDKGASITFDTTQITPGRTKVVTGTVVDANGNPVDTTRAGEAAGDSGTASILVTYTGDAGIVVGSMPTETNANGEFSVAILTSAADRGTLTITAVYMPAGASTPTAERVTAVQAINVGPAAVSDDADTKVNAGSFKGYVAVYAKGYEGQRLSAKVGNDWVVVPALASNFVRVVEFTGAGYTIAVRIYIDRVLVDTITVTTK